jgi:hypothetical protein
MGKGNYAPPYVARENGYEMVYIDYLHDQGETPSASTVRWAWNELLGALRQILETKGYETTDRIEGDLSLIAERWLEGEDSRIYAGIIDYEGLYAAIVLYVDLDEDEEGSTPDEFLTALKKDADATFGTLYRDGYEVRVRTGPWTSGPYTPPVASEDEDPS